MAPFSLIYKWVMQLRNHLYNIGSKPSFEFDQLVVSVGNLSVGGTGKTPFVEYLIRYLLNKEEHYRITTLSRGYGRSSKGFILADGNVSARMIGDEPFQIFRKFKDYIDVSVCEDRVLAVPSILMERPENQIILLDDAFQHRRIKPNFSIMLTEYNRPFYKDYVLPSGLLREARSGASRANVIIITKCPENLDSQIQDAMKLEVQKYAPKAKVFFTTIEYDQISSVSNRNIKKEIVLLTGIANTGSLLSHLEKEYEVKKHFSFSDHHNFSIKEMLEINSEANSLECDILTTEKDWVRIIDNAELYKPVKEKLFYLPIKVQFLNNESEFQSLLDSQLIQNL